jgi:predicted component of type VI protein secretion system
MIRWSARLRRAASLLLGVQLLQVILLAASAVCDPAVLTSGSPLAGIDSPAAAVSAAVPERASALVHHHAEHAVHSQAAPAASDEPFPAEPSAPAHHDPAADCPMAMACTVTAVIADVPTIATRTVIVPALALSQDPEAPASVRPAPETPPPRA